MSANQTGALHEFVRSAGRDLQHVKVHGVLYGMLEKDEALAAAVAEAARESAPDLIVMALASGKTDAACREAGVRVASGGCADRAYNGEGTLVSRKIGGSLITDPARAAEQAVMLAAEGEVARSTAQPSEVSVQSICCHGDTPGAPSIVRAVREALESSGLTVKPLREWLPAA